MARSTSARARRSIWPAAAPGARRQHGTLGVTGNLDLTGGTAAIELGTSGGSHAAAGNRRQDRRHRQPDARRHAEPHRQRRRQRPRCRQRRLLQAVHLHRRRIRLVRLDHRLGRQQQARGGRQCAGRSGRLSRRLQLRHDQHACHFDPLRQHPCRRKIRHPGSQSRKPPAAAAIRKTWPPSSDHRPRASRPAARLPLWLAGAPTV